jgi:prevent-host-death family protein
MKTLPLSEVKTRLSGLVNSVTDTDEEIVITTNGRPKAVIVSYDEFESWKETALIAADPAFMKEIRAGLRSLKRGKAKLYTLDELFS